jgi:hypothetical protein
MGQNKDSTRRGNTEAGRKIPPLLMILVILVMGGMIYGISFLAKRGEEETIRNVVLALSFGILLDYLIADANYAGDFSYNNEKHLWRFVLVFFFCLLVACLLPRLTFLAWPYVVIYVLLTLFSNHEIGFYAATVLLLFSVLLEKNPQPTEFFLYVSIGLVAVSLFRHLDEELRVAFPIAITLSLQMVFLCAYQFLFIHSGLHLSLFVIPLVNLLISLLLLLLISQSFAISVIRGETDRYMDINDPEFALLVAIRSKSKEEYFRAIHTAYLSERMAQELHLRGKPMKSLAYYHRIWILNHHRQDWDEIQPYFVEFDFPREALDLLREYLTGGENAPVSKEATVVMFCDLLVSSLMQAFAQDRERQVEMDSFIEDLVNEKLYHGALNQSELSMRELNEMKKLFKREKLYYDFLR